MPSGTDVPTRLPATLRPQRLEPQLGAQRILPRDVVWADFHGALAQNDLPATAATAAAVLVRPAAVALPIPAPVAVAITLPLSGAVGAILVAPPVALAAAVALALLAIPTAV